MRHRTPSLLLVKYVRRWRAVFLVFDWRKAVSRKGHVNLALFVHQQSGAFLKRQKNVKKTASVYCSSWNIKVKTFVLPSGTRVWIGKWSDNRQELRIDRLQWDLVSLLFYSETYWQQTLVCFELWMIRLLFICKQSSK